MFERFTDHARSVVVSAQVMAREYGHRQIGTEHLLLGVLIEDGVGARVLRAQGVSTEAVRAEIERWHGSDADALRSLGIDLEAIRERTEQIFGPGALERAREQTARRGRRGLLRRRRPEGTGPGHIPFTRGAKKALELSLREALGLKHKYIGTEHLLLGLLWDDDEPGLVILRRLGVDTGREAMRARVLEELARAA